ncbi:unnamed protein product [Rhizoctonia solani]|uniref:Histone H1 n=3 Tax=Rhizoctonia solani TaxID=456999 RepID=A0A8H2WV14_9AGAM|nr:4-alpha-glucanotransferase, putative [Rhizoctonia solani AG-3 Rhs1AP]KEP55229.1 putative 4-alpha-glucanotransferase [Rhizoctonia solani 123E]CAE6401900.1 unnamed protein product [Rhizoctonia solani]CAE6530014.1 unnamed protein product [Rhizoctonia solani]
MDAPAAAEDHAPSTPELKRAYLSLLPQNAIVDLVLSFDSGGTSGLFPADLAGEVRRMQSGAAPDDVDGEGSPDPQPAPPPPRAPSVPPAGGPRTRAGAARAYAAALASKDASSTRPSPAPGGVSFSQTPEPQQPQPNPPAFSPIPQQYPALVVHLPGGSPPLQSPVTPTNASAATTNPLWPPHSPTAESGASSSSGPGPVRNTPVKKTRTGVIGGYNPITSIGPSNEGLPSYEEMIVLALMENHDGEGVAPKDVFAWMSARWPLNANFRPSASQALQKAYKRGRLEKVGNKYKINPNWHGGATTNRTTRRPQSMAEVPGNYAWAPPPVPPVVSVPPDPRARQTSVPITSPDLPLSQSTQAEFDAQAQVASLLKALQEAGPASSNPNPTPSGTDQDQNSNGGGTQTHLPHLTMPGAPLSPAPVQPHSESPAAGSSAVLGLTHSPVQMPQLPISMPPIQPGVPTSPVQTTMSPSIHMQNGIPLPQNPMSPPIQNGMLQIQNGVLSQLSTNMPLPQQPHPHHPPPQSPPQPPHSMPPGVPMPYPPFHAAPTALQASLATLASQLANMSKTNQGA